MSPTSHRSHRQQTRLRAERGSILILTALSMIGLLGIVALVVDGSFMYTERNRMAAAADAGSKSAAYELFIGAGGNLQAYANREVVSHGFAPNPGGDTDVLVEAPPPDGRFAGQAGYVKVTVARTTGTFFARVLGWLNLRPAASAVAGTSNNLNCIITLAPPGSPPQGITLGNTTITMPGCSVANGGDLVSDNPNAFIDAAGISIGASQCTETHGGNCGNIGDYVTNSPPPLDPFASTIAPVPTLSGCTAAPSSGAVAAGGACYSSMDVNGTVTLGAGEVYFTGPITMHSASTLLAPSGTTIVIANGGSLNLPNTLNNLTIRVVAPTSGRYPGIGIYQPASNTSPININNSTSFDITGALYAPTADVSIRNGLDSTSDCVLIVAWTLLIENGNGQMGNACSAYGGTPLQTVSIAE